jgi:hypothetical protein
LHGLVSAFVECPNAAQAHRRDIQHFLEKRERASPGSKERLVKNYLRWTGGSAAATSGSSS